MQDDMMGYDDDEAAQEGGQQEIIDVEELAFIQRMKELKKVYRSNFDHLKEVKGQVFYI